MPFVHPQKFTVHGAYFFLRWSFFFAIQQLDDRMLQLAPSKGKAMAKYVWSRILPVSWLKIWFMSTIIKDHQKWYLSIYIYVYMYICVYVDMYICRYVYIYIYTHVYM